MPTRALILASALVAALYLAQLPGPLRLDGDTGAFLQLAASVADGHGPRPEGVTRYPPGTPLVLGGLEAVGLATPLTMRALNMLFLLAGLVGASIALRAGLGLGRLPATVICLLTAASTLAVRNTVVPTSELPYFAVANLAVAALVVGHGRGRGRLIVAGLLLAVLSCTVRTAGIALVPATVLAFDGMRRRALAAVAATTVGVVAAVGQPRYLDEVAVGWTGWSVAVAEVRDLALVIGTGVGNVPGWAVGRYAVVLVLLGAAVLLLAGVVLVRRRHILGPLDGWLVGCVVLLYAWPGDHARFVLPFLPALLAYAFLAVRSQRVLVATCAAALALGGTAALVYSIRLAYTGDDFPERWARGTYAPSYRVAWGQARPGDAPLAELDKVAALRRFDPRP